MATTSLEEALDNNVAEIMDAEDPFILYTSGSTENQKEWYIPQRVTWSIPHIHSKMYLTMKKMIFSGVLQILVG
jgi:acyl-coenzyme A synthetase/AMP-(fatty) acid ligase